MDRDILEFILHAVRLYFDDGYRERQEQRETLELAGKQLELLRSALELKGLPEQDGRVRSILNQALTPQGAVEADASIKAISGPILNGISDEDQEV